MPAKKEPFKPEEHFRNLKGQQYLEVKWRVVWFREEHPDGYIRAELIEHDPTNGLAVFKAQVGYLLADGREVYAADYGSETRKDFNDYLEKASTKAIGRALAMLGYGTAQAIELDEEERIVDSPASKPTKDVMGIGEMRNAVKKMLETDTAAGALMPKAIDDCNDGEAGKAYAWLMRRKQAVGTAGK